MVLGVLMAGAVLGRGELIERIRRQLNLFGGSLDPHAAVLLHRGLKTLAVRVERQNANALHLATLLERHPAVTQVNYPGLESHPGHEIAKRQQRGFGGMVSFEIAGGEEAVRAFVDRLQYFSLAESLGGVESLIEQPAILTHASVPPENRRALDIGDGFIRLSVGIEDVDDLRADLERALAAAKG